MKKIIAVAAPLFFCFVFSFTTYAQSNAKLVKTIELSDSDHIVIMVKNDSASVGGFVKPKHKADGSVWFIILGDTTKWGKKDFDWQYESVNINCWIPHL